MSALPKADIDRDYDHVRLGPEPDLGQSAAAT